MYYLHGDDDYLKDGAVRDLLEASIDPSTRDFNCEIRRASELDAEAVSSLLSTPPMLAEKRAVVLRDVTALKKAARQQLDLYLKRPASDTLLLLVSPAGTKVDAAIAAASETLEFAPLTPERVRRWIAHHATTVLTVGIADDAAQLLQQAVGNDLHQLATLVMARHWSVDYIWNVRVAIAIDSTKAPLFTPEQRVQLIQANLRGLPNVDVVSFDGLLVKFARKQKAQAIIRGLRALSDFEFEFNMALMNRHLEPKVETIFVMPNESYSYTSSSLVKQIAKLGGDVSKFVPPNVAKALREVYPSA